MEIEISKTEKLKDPKNKEYISYLIKVTVGKHSWTVSRRYQRFETLHAEIQPLGQKVPSLPAAKWGRSVEKEYAEAKSTCLSLQDYLRSLIKIDDVRNSNPFCEFIVSTLPEILINYNEEEMKKEKAILAEAQLASEQRVGLLAQISRQQDQIERHKAQCSALQASLTVVTEQWQALEEREKQRAARSSSGKTPEQVIEELEAKIKLIKEEEEKLKKENIKIKEEHQKENENKELEIKREKEELLKKIEEISQKFEVSEKSNQDKSTRIIELEEQKEKIRKK